MYKVFKYSFFYWFK